MFLFDFIAICEESRRKSATGSSSSSFLPQSAIPKQQLQRHENYSLDQKQLELAEGELKDMKASLAAVKKQCNVEEESGGKIKKALRDERNELEGKDKLITNM